MAVATDSSWFNCQVLHPVYVSFSDHLFMDSFVSLEMTGRCVLMSKLGNEMEMFVRRPDSRSRMVSKAARVQVKECLGSRKCPFLSYQDIIIFTVLFSAGDIFFPLGHVDKCIFCLIIAVNHRGFMVYVMADSTVPEFTGIHSIFFGRMFLGGQREREMKLQRDYTLKKSAM